MLRSRLTVAPLVLPTSDRHIIFPGEISPEPDVEQKWLQRGTAVTAALTTTWERLNVQKWNRHRLLGSGRVRGNRHLLQGAVAVQGFVESQNVHCCKLQPHHRSVRPGRSVVNRGDTEESRFTLSHKSLLSCLTFRSVFWQMLM